MVDDDRATETAWRIHAAVADWTGKVDSKASFALTIESAVLAVLVSLSGSGHRLHGVHGRWGVGFYWTGTGLLILGALAAASVVAPRLRHRKTKNEADTNFIYFGHLRHWTSDDLESALRSREVLPVLARQLVVMSKIAWTKHLRVEASMGLAVLGTAAVAVAAFIR